MADGGGRHFGAERRAVVDFLAIAQGFPRFDSRGPEGGQKDSQQTNANYPSGRDQSEARIPERDSIE